MVTVSPLSWNLPPDWDEKIELIRQTAIRKNLSFAFAESCTGGMLSSLVTKLAGASQVFKGACVTYSNESKTQLLSVPSSLLEANGAVSEAVALAMAMGVKKALRADLSLAITGVAGPGGGTPSKPVGMVCFAAIGLGQYSSVKTQYFQGSREQVQEASVAYALNLLIDLVNM